MINFANGRKLVHVGGVKWLLCVTDDFGDLVAVPVEILLSEV